MGFQSFSFRSLLDWESSLKKRFLWLEKCFENSESSRFTSLKRGRIFLGISMLFHPPLLVWSLLYGPNSESRHPFVYCSIAIPFVISFLCSIFLPYIRKSSATKEESIFLYLLFFILSIVLGTLTNLAGAPNLFGLCLNCSYILWGFFLEHALGLKTKMSLVNMGASMSIGFVRNLYWWWRLIVVPICLVVVVGLHLFSWRFALVIFPDDSTDLVPLLERENQQLNPIIMEAIQKANEHLADLNVNLNAYDYEANKKTIEDVEKDSDSTTLEDVEIHMEQKLYPLIMEDLKNAEEYKAVLYSILDAKKCATSLVDSNTLKDAKIPVLLLVREHKLNQLITDAIRKAGEYQTALISVLDVINCLASKLDSKILEYAKIPVLLQEMKQHLDQLVMETKGEAEEYGVASEASNQTMEDVETGWVSPFNIGR